MKKSKDSDMRDATALALGEASSSSVTIYNYGTSNDVDGAEDITKQRRLQRKSNDYNESELIDLLTRCFEDRDDIVIETSILASKENSMQKIILYLQQLQAKDRHIVIPTKKPNNCWRVVYCYYNEQAKVTKFKFFGNFKIKDINEIKNQFIGKDSHSISNSGLIVDPQIEMVLNDFVSTFPLERMTELLSIKNTFRHVSDEKEQLVIGEEKFPGLMRKKGIYVDKTLIIRDFFCEDKESRSINSGEVNVDHNKLKVTDKVTVIIRPTRFGKSLMLDMLESFFDYRYRIVGKRSKDDPFTKLNIVDYPNLIEKHQWTYPVIKLNFLYMHNINSLEDFKEDFKRVFRKIIRSAYEKFSYIEEYLDSEHHEKYRYVHEENFDTQFTLVNLVRCVSYYCKRMNISKRPIILIDEYDAPLISASLGQHWEDGLNLIRSFLHACFKGDHSDLFEFAIIAGVSRFAGENLFSKLNNTSVYTLFDKKFSPYFGFSRKEIRKYFVDKYLGKTESIKILDNWQDWYGSYYTGDSVLFNSWSVTQAFKTPGNYKPHWGQLEGGQDILLEQIKLYQNEMTNDLLLLINNGIIEKQITAYVSIRPESTSLDKTLNKKNDHIDGPTRLWSLLYLFGYLTAIPLKDGFTNERGSYFLIIPNKETFLYFRNKVLPALEIDKEKLDVFSIDIPTPSKEALISGDSSNFAKAPKKNYIQDKNKSSFKSREAIVKAWTIKHYGYKELEAIYQEMQAKKETPIIYLSFVCSLVDYKEIPIRFLSYFSSDVSNFIARFQRLQWLKVDENNQYLSLTKEFHSFFKEKCVETEKAGELNLFNQILEKLLEYFSKNFNFDPNNLQSFEPAKIYARHVFCYLEHYKKIQQDDEKMSWFRLASLLAEYYLCYEMNFSRVHYLLNLIADCQEYYNFPIDDEYIARINSMRGRFYDEIGQFGEAERCFREANAIFISYRLLHQEDKIIALSQARNYLFWTFLNEKHDEYKEGIAKIEKAIECISMPFDIQVVSDSLDEESTKNDTLYLYATNDTDFSLEYCFRDAKSLLKKGVLKANQFLHDEQEEMKRVFNGKNLSLNKDLKTKIIKLTKYQFKATAHKGYYLFLNFVKDYCEAYYTGSLDTIDHDSNRHFRAIQALAKQDGNQIIFLYFCKAIQAMIAKLSSRNYKGTNQLFNDAVNELEKVYSIYPSNHHPEVLKIKLRQLAWPCDYVRLSVNEQTYLDLIEAFTQYYPKKIDDYEVHPLCIADLYASYGDYLLSRSKLDHALIQYENAEAILEKIFLKQTPNKRLLSLYISMGKANRLCGNFVQARRNYDLALTYCNPEVEPRLYAELHNESIAYALSQFNLDLAYQLICTLLTCPDKKNNSQKLASYRHPDLHTIHINKLNVACYAGDYSYLYLLSQDYLYQYCDFADEVMTEERMNNILRTLNTLIETSILLNQHDFTVQCIEVAKKGIGHVNESYRYIESPLYARVYLNEAIICSIKGEKENAKKQFEKAKSIFKTFNLSEGCSDYDYYHYCQLFLYYVFFDEPFSCIDEIKESFNICVKICYKNWDILLDKITTHRFDLVRIHHLLSKFYFLQDNVFRFSIRLINEYTKNEPNFRHEIHIIQLADLKYQIGFLDCYGKYADEPQLIDGSKAPQLIECLHSKNYHNGDICDDIDIKDVYSELMTYVSQCKPYKRSAINHLLRAKAMLQNGDILPQLYKDICVDLNSLYTTNENHLSNGKDTAHIVYDELIKLDRKIYEQTLLYKLINVSKSKKESLLLLGIKFVTEVKTWLREQIASQIVPETYIKNPLRQLELLEEAASHKNSRTTILAFLVSFYCASGNYEKAQTMLDNYMSHVKTNEPKILEDNIKIYLNLNLLYFWIPGFTAFGIEQIELHLETIEALPDKGYLGEQKISALHNYACLLSLNTPEFEFENNLDDTAKLPEWQKVIGIFEKIMPFSLSAIAECGNLFCFRENFKAFIQLVEKYNHLLSSNESTIANIVSFGTQDKLFLPQYLQDLIATHPIIIVRAETLIVYWLNHCIKNNHTEEGLAISLQKLLDKLVDKINQSENVLDKKVIEFVLSKEQKQSSKIRKISFTKLATNKNSIESFISEKVISSEFMDCVSSHSFLVHKKWIAKNNKTHLTLETTMLPNFDASIFHFLIAVKRYFFNALEPSFKEVFNVHISNNIFVITIKNEIRLLEQKSKILLESIHKTFDDTFHSPCYMSFSFQTSSEDYSIDKETKIAKEHISNLPSPIQHEAIAQNEIKDISTKFSETLIALHKNQAKPIVIIGPKNIGKSGLAFAYGRASLDDYPGGIWRFEAEDVSMCYAGYRQLAEVLKLMTAAKSDKQVVKEVQRRLRYQGRMLLIFVNAVNFEQLTPFLPRDTHHILITSEIESAWEECEQLVFTTQIAIRRTYLPISTSNLMNDSLNSPLSHQNEQPMTSFQIMKIKMQPKNDNVVTYEGYLKYLENDNNDRARKTLQFIFRNYLSQEAIEILKIAVCLSPERVPCELFDLMIEESSLRKKALDELSQWMLISFENKQQMPSQNKPMVLEDEKQTFRVFSAVRREGRNFFSEKYRITHSNETIPDEYQEGDFLNEIAISLNEKCVYNHHNAEDSYKFSRYVVHMVYFVKILKEYLQKNDVPKFEESNGDSKKQFSQLYCIKGELEHKLGVFYLCGNRDFNAARIWLQHALDDFSAAAMSFDKRIAKTYQFLGYLSFLESDLEQLTGCLSKITNVVNRLNDEIERNECLVGQYLLEGDLGLFKHDYQSAKTAFQKAFDLNQRVLHPNNPNHPEVAIPLLHIGYILLKQGSYIEAKNVLNEVLARQEYGHQTKIHPQVIVTLLYLGEAHYCLGEYDDAKNIVEEALRNCKKYYGDGPQLDTVRCRLWRGDIYFAQKTPKACTDAKKEYEEAQHMLKELEEVCPETTTIKQLRSNIKYRLARIYYFEGQYDDAKDLFEKALNYPEGGMDVLFLKENIYLELTYLYCRQRDFEKALAHVNQSYDKFSAIFGEKHPDVIRCLHAKARILHECDDLEDAYHTTVQAIQLWNQLVNDKKVPRNHAIIAILLQEQGELFISLGCYPESEKAFERALFIQRELFKNEKHMRIAIAQRWLALAKYHQEPSKDATDLTQKALEAQVTSLPLRHHELARTYYQKGVIFARLLDYRNAERFYEEANHVLESCHGYDKFEPWLIDLLTSILELYCYGGYYGKDVKFPGKLISYTERAYDVAIRSYKNSHRMYGKAKYLKGLAYFFQSQWKEANEAFQEARTNSERIQEQNPYLPSHATSFSQFPEVFKASSSVGFEKHDKRKQYVKLLDTDIAIIYRTVARVYLNLGEIDKCNKFCQLALAIQKKYFSMNDPEILTTQYIEILKLAKEKKYKPVKVQLAAIFKQQKLQHGNIPAHPIFARMFISYGEALFECNLKKKAQKALEKGIKNGIECYGTEKNYITALAKEILAKFALKNHKFVDAFYDYYEAYQILKDVLDESHADVLRIKECALRLRVQEMIKEKMNTAQMLEALFELEGRGELARALKLIRENKETTLDVLRCSELKYSDEDRKAFVSALMQNTVLTSFYIRNCELDDEMLKTDKKALNTKSKLKTFAEYFNGNTKLKILDLSKNKLGVDSACTIAFMLKTNETLKSLNLAHNSIGAQGATLLSSALTDTGPYGFFSKTTINRSLELLNLEENEIQTKGALALSNMLKKNYHLGVLNIAKNSIENAGVIELGKALEINKKLETLNVAENSIDSNGIFSLANSLQKNETLRTLDLSENKMGDGGQEIEAINALLSNELSLTALNLANNHMTVEGLNVFMEQLSMNKTLLSLNLENNNIDDSILAKLIEALKGNNTLLAINLAHNKISAEGVKKVSTIFQQYNHILIHLDLSRNPIDISSVLALQMLLRDRHFPSLIISPDETSLSQLTQEEQDMLMKEIHLLNEAIEKNNQDPAKIISQDYDSRYQTMDKGIKQIMPRFKIEKKTIRCANAEKSSLKRTFLDNNERVTSAMFDALEDVLEQLPFVDFNDDKLGRELYGLKIGDDKYELGNSLFEAIAKLSSGFNAQEIRKLTIESIEKNIALQIKINEFIINGKNNSLRIKSIDVTEWWREKVYQSVEDYLELMRQDQTWGTEIELVALAYALKRPIVVLTPKNEYDFVIPENFYHENEPIFLSYVNSYQFEPLLVPIECNSREILKKILNNIDKGDKNQQQVLNDGSLREASSPNATIFHKYLSKNKNKQRLMDDMDNVVMQIVLWLSTIELQESEYKNQRNFYGTEPYLIHYQEGDCLFASIAAFEPNETAMSLRKRATQYIEQDEQLKSSIITLINSETPETLRTKEGDKVIESFSYYIILMSEPETWGTAIEIVALARSLQRPVAILTPNNQYDYIVEEEAYRNNQPIFLNYVGEIHYTPLSVPENKDAKMVLEEIRQSIDIRQLEKEVENSYGLLANSFSRLFRASTPILPISELETSASDTDTNTDIESDDHLEKEVEQSSL